MIKEIMKFTTPRDFYNHRDRIKDKYDCLSTNDKIIYKYYIYSKRFISVKTCDILWSFLNDDFDDSSEEYEDVFRHECFKYR